MNTHAYGQRVNYFSTNVSIFYPIIFNAGAIPGSRFEHLVFMPELIKNNINTMNEKNFYIDTVTSDINQYNPKFIFINAIDRGTGGNKTNSYIDYISFFSQSDKFKTVWKKYHYYTTIESPGIVLKFPVFKIDVYQRG